jgi:hypothetical protein
MPGARVGQVEDAFPYRLRDANGTDTNFVSYIPNEADYISYHAANFRENAVNTTADIGSRTRVAFSLSTPCSFFMNKIVVTPSETRTE